MPGHKRANLLVIPKPNAMESQSRDKDTNAVARERYQYAFGASPLKENAMFGKKIGSNKTATSNPTTPAKRNNTNDWMFTEDSNSSGVCELIDMITPYKYSYIR
jgi:hypothetical protein